MSLGSEALTDLKTYSPDVVSKIESLGATAVAIANRWMMGWPDRVIALLSAGVYLDSLEHQINQEKEILANEANWQHLAPREILALYEIKESPSVIEKWARE